MKQATRLMSIPVAVAAVLAIGVTVVAAGFASGFMPGKSTVKVQAVMASYIDSEGNYVSVEAVSGPLSFFTDDGGVTAPVQTTAVLVDAFTPSGVFGSGCWTVPSSPFAIRANDNSAALTFDSSAPGVAVCPGQLVAVAAAIQSSVTPHTINENLNGAVSLSARWSPSGVATTMDTENRITCLSWRGIFQYTQMWQNSLSSAHVASFTVDGFDNDGNEVVQSFAGDYATDFAVVTTRSSNQVVQGPSSGICGPFGSS